MLESTFSSAAPATAGTGAACAEAQADGVPCAEAAADCSICGRAAPCPHVEVPAAAAQTPEPQAAGH
jgi:hypothetical protein